MSDLFSEAINVALPPQFAVQGRVHKNPIQQLLIPRSPARLQMSEFSTRHVSGFDGLAAQGARLRILSRKTATDLGPDPILLISDATTIAGIKDALGEGRGRWLTPRPVDVTTLTLAQCEERAQATLASWKGRFHFIEEGIDENGEPKGLRAPQIGALHATLAHWSVSEEPATIVMPTGTGKTETMLAVLTCTGVERLIVVVPPNNPLRDQIAEKFLTLGVLKRARVLDSDALYPIVATLEHRPQSPDEVDEIFRRANVIVTTMAIAGQCAPDVQERMAQWATHLFVDEAHHLAARTWTEFRSYFLGKARILQFTATPFRTDGKRVDGRFIYVYPLAKAQKEGYFKKIRFRGVYGLDQATIDTQIIARVGQVLADDLAEGRDHLVIARVESIKRAEALHQRYLARYPQHAPVLVHSKMSATLKREALTKIRSRSSKIVVCADMLGEGFDLPELKIAALHDRHKSIAITLQFTGRITRARDDLGEATVIANISQDDVEDALRSLYAEDADWNFLLTVLSEGETGRQRKRAEILQGFADKLHDIPLQVLAPRMSTVVFRTKCEDWKPFNVDDAIPATAIHAGPVLNAARKLALFITRDEEPVRWGEVKQIVNTTWNLYLLHWDDERNLLFINSSKTGDLHDHVAKAVCGEDVERISGDTVFRSLHGFKRLVLSNLGLSHLLGRYLRYTMFMGSDITEQLSDAATQGKRKSNLFGQGFSQGEKATIGCSAKGKIWSHQATRDFSEWLEWCGEIGTKLLDPSITTDDIIKNLIKPTKISARPDQPPIAIHWPESFLEQFEERIDIILNGVPVGFHDCDIQLATHSDSGPLLFTVIASERGAAFEIVINDAGYSYPLRSPGTALARIGSKTKTLSEWFADDPPHVHFASGDFLVFNELFKLPEMAGRTPFDLAKITPWDWRGVNLRKESQGPAKDPASIQRRTIERLIAGPEEYDIIFDDDDTGEIADIVGIKRIDTMLLRVDLYHCKFMSGTEPGHRVKDLYEVCGQAQKCVRWRQHPHRLFKHLLRREKDRRDAGQLSRFEVGDPSSLANLANRWREFRYEYRMFIVQPGVSKRQVTVQQLDLFAATEAYLLDTYNIPLRVFSSA